MSDALKYFNRENYRRALELFLEDIENASSREEVAYNANLAGLCLYFLHSPDEALKYFNMALENTEGEDRAKVQENIDEVKRFVDRVKKDIESIEERLEEEIEDKNRGILLSNLGLLHYFLGNKDDAEEAFQRAEVIFKKMNDNVALGALYSNFAMLYDDMRKLNYLYRALDIFEKEGHMRGQADTLHSLAMYYLEDDYEDEALFFLRKEEELVDALNDGEMRRRLYELMAEIEMGRGNVKEALKYTERASL